MASVAPYDYWSRMSDAMARFSDALIRLGVGPEKLNEWSARLEKADDCAEVVMQLLDVEKAADNAGTTVDCMRPKDI